MAQELDPQVSSALITTGGGLATGVIGTVGAFWARRRRRATQDQRCERICTNMVAIGDTLLAVIKAIGADDPRLATYIAQMEVRIEDARAWLDQNSTQ